jgi:class 3 adenylate cyclase/outer membrane protein OmpA-like peptidoglycan-associated protein
MNIAGEGRTERRLAAILAADVVGYSRLMGNDEEGTLFALKAVRREVTDPKIEEHRGRLVKTTGDGMLVEFASVVDAVRCAVDIQRELKWRYKLKPAADPIVLRIGVNLGDIIIDEADIFGDGVNVAARLEGLADPGGICVSRIVRDQVRDKLGFGFEDLGLQQVKNIARPLHVFRIPLDASSSAAAGRTDEPDRAKSRRGLRVLAGVGGSAALVAGALLFLRISAGPEATPASPVVEDAVFFDRDKVALSQSAGASLKQQADFLRANPGVKVTVRAYCSDDEGAREGPQVLAQLRANQVRDALKARGISGDRIKIDNACRPGDAALSGADEATQAQNRRAVLVRN